MSNPAATTRDGNLAPGATTIRAGGGLVDSHLTDAELICRAWGIDRPIPAAGLFGKAGKDAGASLADRDVTAPALVSPLHSAEVSDA